MRLLDGEEWYTTKRGRVFNGDVDQITRVDYEFCEPSDANTMRIVHHLWNNYISMRFESYFILRIDNFLPLLVNQIYLRLNSSLLNMISKHKTIKVG